MNLTKIKIGKLVELYSEACNIPDLTINDVSGINRDKEFFEPSKQVGSNTSKYKIVPPNYFACNLMHVGRDKVLPISLNHTTKNKIVSPAYTVFKITNSDNILTEYFFIMIKSIEKDRFFWFNTDSSVREGLEWEIFCDIDIELPPITIQQKYVDIYTSMLKNQKYYEIGLDDLKLTCDAYVEKLIHSTKLTKLSGLIEKMDERNSENKYNNVKGISINKEFIETKADMKNVSLKPYKIVKPDFFAFVTVTSRNSEKITIAHNPSNEVYICSSSYIVFKILDSTKLLSDYLNIFFSRNEFDRYARFHSWGSAREVFSWEDMCDVQIPVPAMNIQKAIADIYKVYKERQEINEYLKLQIKNICPILIKGALEEAKRAEV